MQDFKNSAKSEFKTRYAIYIDGIVLKNEIQEHPIKNTQKFHDLKISPNDRLKQLKLGVVPILAPINGGASTPWIMGHIHDLDENDVFDTKEEAAEKLDDIRNFLKQRSVKGLNHIQSETIDFLDIPEKDRTHLIVPILAKGDALWFVNNADKSVNEIIAKQTNINTIWNDFQEPVEYEVLMVCSEVVNHRKNVAYGLRNLEQNDVHSRGIECYAYPPIQEAGQLFTNNRNALEYAISLTENYLDNLKTRKSNLTP